jgi:hypothetical protein
LLRDVRIVVGFDQSIRELAQAAVGVWNDFQEA